MGTCDIETMRASLRRAGKSLRLRDVADRLRMRGAGGLVQRADDIMHGIYTFTKTWDMERCDEPYEFYGQDWNVVNNNDEEWCFMLNRMDYLIDLVSAALSTGELAYAQHALTLIGSWIAAHPHMEPELSTRTLDTGIRIGSWAQVLPALEDLGLLGDEDLRIIRDSINAQIAYLRARYIAKYETSNWGSIQTLAVLYVLCTLEGEPESHPAWGWAYGRVESQMRAQVYPDGIDWEQSTMYHVEVLLSALRAQHALGLRGIDAPAHLEQATVRLAHALCAQMMPSGSIDAQGDSDRCDVRSLLALCAAVCGDAQIGSVCGRTELDDQNLFEYGCAVEDRLSSLIGGCELPPLQFDGVDGGLYITRSSWQDDATWTLFSHGPLGSGHGHSDNLHMSCAYRGVPVFIDSGRYTYREDDPLRPALKSPASHNTLLLDGVSNCRPKGSWGYYDFAQPLKAFSRHADEASYYEGALVGHDPLNVFVRKLVVLDCGVWLGCDEVFADGDHEVEARFHVDPDLRVVSSAEGASAEPDGRVGLVGGGISLGFGTTGSLVVEHSACSLAYNELQTQALLRAHIAISNRGGMLWWLAPQGVEVLRVPVLRNLEMPVEPTLAEALRFEVSSDEFYTVVVFHSEVYSGVKAFSCEGVSFHAKTAVIHGVGRQRDLKVLRA